MPTFKPGVLVITLVCNHFSIFGQAKQSRLLQKIFATNTNTIFNEVIQNPLKYRCQIIYTQINRDRDNIPHFKNYYFNYNPLLYFNPASTVKMPLAFLALEKLNKIAIPGVDKYSSLQIDSNFYWQRPAYADTTSKNRYPSIAHYIKKAFLVSDNDAYNRMYQFLGQQYINDQLRKKGYKRVRITRQFMGLTPEQNRHTNSLRFLSQDGSNLYLQHKAYNIDSFTYSNIIKIGKAHFDSRDSLIPAPFDFTGHNEIALEDLQKMLQSVLFPTSTPRFQRFLLSSDDRSFLLQFLSQFPSESNFPKYDTLKYYDSYVKFYFRANQHLPAGVRVFNKVGWAYGFMTDVSYIVDFTNKIEFMLSATLYVNSDGILNDNRYDYDSIGYPFYSQLGQTMYQFELRRKRECKPILRSFVIDYEKRDKDERPTISDVDN